MTAPQWIRPEPDNDPRFTIGLVIDVARVLAEHGYPSPSDYRKGGLVDLQQALYRFVVEQERRVLAAAAAARATKEADPCE